MKKPQFKILAVDGGGIRGILPCIVLKFIEEQLGDLSTFDLMAGTSTGGIIVTGLNTKNIKTNKEFSAQDLLELYVKHGQKIFSHRQEDFLSKIGKLIGNLGKVVEKPYDETSLENLLEKYFGSTKLNQLKRDILVTSYDFKSGRPFYFSSRLAKSDEKENYYLKEVTRATSAAPTYFEPHLNRYDKNQDILLVDGGIFANNPSILAYTEAKEVHKEKKRLQALAYGERAFNPVVSSYDDDLPFYLLSIGTGTGKFEFTTTTAVKNWRSANWIFPLLTDSYMRSVSESTHYTMQHLLPAFHDATPRYQRINFNIPVVNSSMDNISIKNINQLQDIGAKYIKENQSELMKICEILSL